MEQIQTLLLSALRAAPRRHRMPPLPADARAAAAGAPETALAFALEAARRAGLSHAPPPGAVPALFTRSLAELIRAALAPEGGDPAFQALVLRAHDAEVAEHARLSARLAADRRALRAAVDALAHPGKLRALAPGAARDALARLHGLATHEAWAELAEALHARLASPAPPAARDALQALAGHAALRRLARGQALLRQAGVRRFLALCNQRGPQAGSGAAAAQGRAAARLGELAEQATLQAFGRIAEMLNAQGGGGALRAVRGLRTPPGFPGEQGKAKDEWDAALLQAAADGQACEIVLLAEVKAAPAAATPDFARLHRGLERLAQADAAAHYAFASADGELRVHGASLRRLRPHGRALPPHVIYCCPAAPEAQVPMLSAAARAVLLAEPASLAYAYRLAQGEAPSHADLLPVWDALPAAPRLHSALQQYATAQAVREAMLHPQDLLEAVAAALGRDAA